MNGELKQTNINTKQPDGPDFAPRFPHERDESTTNRSSVKRPEIQQASQDLKSGQVDTDLRNGGKGVEKTLPKSANNSRKAAIDGASKSATPVKNPLDDA